MRISATSVGSDQPDSHMRFCETKETNIPYEQPTRASLIVAETRLNTTALVDEAMMTKSQAYMPSSCWAKARKMSSVAGHGSATVPAS